MLLSPIIPHVYSFMGYIILHSHSIPFWDSIPISSLLGYHIKNPAKFWNNPVYHSIPMKCLVNVVSTDIPPIFATSIHPEMYLS
jgi:hypothetical protein